MADFISDLVAFPSPGSAFRIYAYPVVNQGSLETPPQQPDHRPFDESRRKLKPAEASVIERELFVVQFHGLIVIQTAEENEGLQATVNNTNCMTFWSCQLSRPCGRSSRSRKNLFRSFQVYHCQPVA